MRRRDLLAATLVSGLAAPTISRAQGKPLKLALIADRTGPLEAYAKQMWVGFYLGLEYATKGSNAVAGRTLSIVEKDSQFKPEMGRNLLAEAYGDDNAELAIGGTASNVALAMLPVAQENKKVLIVDGAVADAITGAAWNKYIFRVDRNSMMDAISNALSIGKSGVTVATLAQDYAFGRDGVKAFKAALGPTGAKLVHEEYAPPTTTDFTAPAQRIFDALAKESDEKYIFVIWAGADPMGKLAAMNPERLGIKLSTGGNILPSLKAYKSIPALNGMQGATYYYYEIPKNPINDWLVAEHTKRHGEPPDFFTCNGMVTALGLVAALEKTKGVTDADTLIAAMEGLAYDSPKGRVMFRAEDHQLLQSMFGFKLDTSTSKPWAVPVETHEFTMDEMKIPITNKR
jgi:branched-chain amino acid transport system substrate-binding protein